MTQEEKSEEIQAAVDELLKRLRSLRGLQKRKIITADLLGRQLLQLMSAPQAGILMDQVPEEERKARRLLIRLGDPGRWRTESTQTGAARKKLLMSRLADIFSESSTDSEELLNSLMDVAQLPHFASFVNSGRPSREEENGKSGGKVSVLD